MARSFFSLCPHYTISFGFCQADRQRPQASGQFRSPSVCRPYQNNQKRGLNALSVLGLAFSFVFDFARSPTDAAPQTCAGVAAQRVCVARCWRKSTAAGHLGLACLTECHYVFTAQLAFSLCGLLDFVPKSSSRNMVTACNNRVVRCSCSSQTRQKLLLAPLTYLRRVGHVLNC